MQKKLIYLIASLILTLLLNSCMTAITMGNIQTKYTPADSLNTITDAVLDTNNNLLINFVGQSKMKKATSLHIKTNIQALHDFDAPNNKHKMISKTADRDINTVDIQLKRSVLKKGYKKLKTSEKELPYCITANNCIHRGNGRESQKTSSFSFDFYHKNGLKYEITLQNKTQHPHRWQVVLLPFTLAADIITSPLQIIGYFVLKSDLKQ